MKTPSLAKSEKKEKPSPTPLLHPISDVSAVTCKPTRSREMEMQRQSLVQKDDWRKQAQICRYEVKGSDKYSAYRDNFIEIMT